MEFRRATIRITSNYVRLIASVCLTLYLFRALTGLLGDDVMGLIFLLTSTVGIAAIVEEAASWSMIRELGASHHSGDDGLFRRTFNSAYALSAGLTAIILVVFGIVLMCLPLMEIPDGLLHAARWFVIAKAIETAVLVLLAPPFNMYLVTERMVAHNFWVTMRRVVGVLAVIVLFQLNVENDPALGLIIYGWLSCALMVLMNVLAVVLVTMKDQRLKPAPSLASRAGVRGLLGISGWNLAILGAQQCVFPLGAIIMNVAFGVKLNQVFGYSTTLAGYARMLASGMTVGLDAVAARLSTVHAEQPMRDLVRTSTMLHGLVLCPAVVGVAMLARPMLQLWVESKVKFDPVGTIAASAALTRILLIGFAVMLLTDCWTRLLFGAGFVRRYGPLMIVGNVVVPAVAVLLLLVLPEAYRYTSVSWAFTLAYSAFFMTMVPQITAKAFGMTYWEVVNPLVKPLAASIFCIPILWWFVIGVVDWNLLWLGTAAMAYGVGYGLLSWFFVLGLAERTRVTAAIRARLPLGLAG